MNQAVVEASLDDCALVGSVRSMFHVSRVMRRWQKQTNVVLHDRGDQDCGLIHATLL